MIFLKKIFMFIVVALCIAASCCIFVTLLFFSEFKTALSFETILSENKQYVYYTNVSGNYYMDDFIEANGSYNNKDLSNFLNGYTSKNLLPVKEIEINEMKTTSSSVTFNENNETILATNSISNTNSTLIVQTNSTNAYKSISTVNLGYFGVTTELEFFDKTIGNAAVYLPSNGINEKGLSVSLTYNDEITNDISYSNTSAIDINELTLVRMLLDNCETVDDAIKVLKYDNPLYDIFLAFDKHFTINVVDSSHTVTFTSSEDIFNDRNLLKITTSDPLEIKTNTTSDVCKLLNSISVSNTYTVMYNINKKTVDYYLYGDTSINKTFTL